MGGDVFAIMCCPRRPERADMVGVSEQIFWGRQTLVTVSDVNPSAVLHRRRRRQEYWLLLFSGDGLRIEATTRTPAQAGTLWRVSAASEFEFRAGVRGARILEFYAATNCEVGLNYVSLGELPPDVCYCST